MRKIEAINQKLVKGLEKLKQIKGRYNADSKKIIELIQKRAGLLADEALESNPHRKKEIDELNKEIENLKRATESRGPELIEALQKRLQGIELEKSNEELRLSFEKQKKVGAEIVDLSGKLIENLGQANSINQELDKAWNEYTSLSKNTKKGAIKEDSKTTRGSLGGLKFLFGILNYEYTKGKPRPRGDIPAGIRI